MIADLPLDRAGLAAHQFACLQDLLSAIVPRNRFYAEKLTVAGVTASIGDYIARVPFTVKQELVDDQLSNPPFGTNLTYPIERYTRQWQTSGTSGSPMRWLDTAALKRVRGTGAEFSISFSGLRRTRRARPGALRRTVDAKRKGFIRLLAAVRSPSSSRLGSRSATHSRSGGGSTGSPP